MRNLVNDLGFWAVRWIEPWSPNGQFSCIGNLPEAWLWSNPSLGGWMPLDPGSAGFQACWPVDQSPRSEKYGKHLDKECQSTRSGQASAGNATGDPKRQSSRGTTGDSGWTSRMRELCFSLVTVRALCSGAWAHTHKASDRHAPLPCMTRNSMGNFLCRNGRSYRKFQRSKLWEDHSW